MKFRVRVIETKTVEWVGEVEAKDEDDFRETFEPQQFTRSTDSDVQSSKTEYRLYDFQDSEEAFRRF